MSKVLVIVCPFMEPYRPPLSAAIVCEVSRLAGHEVVGIDLNIELYHLVGPKKFHELEMDYAYNTDYVWEGMDAYLESQMKDLGSYDHILISVFSFFGYGLAKTLCKFIKDRCSTPILLGGPAVRFPMNDSTMLGLVNESYKEDRSIGAYLRAKGLIDDYIVGEGEIALAEFFKGNKTFPGINNQDSQQIDDLENLPIPNYDYFDLSRYDYLRGKPDIIMLGSRGCVKKCTFCDVSQLWPKYRYRSGNSLAKEMIMHYERYGVTDFYLADSLINGSIKAFNELLEALVKYDTKKIFRWGGMAILRPKNQHVKEMYDMIAETGTSFWIVGVETFVERVRYEMGKRFSNDDLMYHLEQSTRIGLENVFLMMTTWPSETLAEHEENINFYPKLKKYIANGSLLSMNTHSRLLAIEGTSMIKQLGLTFNDPVLQKLGLPKESFWHCPTNPELTMKERIRRSMNVVKAAYDNKLLPLQLDSTLLDISKFVDLIKEHPELEIKPNDQSHI